MIDAGQHPSVASSGMDDLLRSSASISSSDPIHPEICLTVKLEHHITLARKIAKAMAERNGFTPIHAACVTTCVSELASNLFFHTQKGGTIMLRFCRCNEDIGLEVIASDSGPGIEDIDAAMRDGFSTDGGLGGGLPGAERLMDEFRIQSTVGSGTRITAVKWQRCK